MRPKKKLGFGFRYGFWVSNPNPNPTPYPQPNFFEFSCMKISDLNEILKAKSNEINDLKLRLNKYEPNQKDKSEQNIFNKESNQDVSTN